MPSPRMIGILVVHQAILLLQAAEMPTRCCPALPRRKRIWERRVPWRTMTLKVRGDDLGVELALIARRHLVEGAAAVGDQAREDVEPAGGALGIGGGGDPGAELEPLQQRHDIDAVPLQDRALGQVDLMQGELLDLLGDGRVLAGQEAGAHAIGDGAQAQIEARRLHLLRPDIVLGPDLVVADQRLDLLIGQDAGTLQRRRRVARRAGAGRVRWFQP